MKRDEITKDALSLDPGARYLDANESLEFPLDQQPDRSEPVHGMDEASFNDPWLRLPGFAVGSPNRHEVKQFDVTAMSVAASDNWLTNRDDAYIGGGERSYGRQAYDAHKGTPGDYMFETPDGDARGDENFAESDVVYGPANADFKAPQPGRVGAVQKQRDMIEKGTFTSWLRDVTSTPAGFECAE